MQTSLHTAHHTTQWVNVNANFSLFFSQKSVQKKKVELVQSSSEEEDDESIDLDDTTDTEESGTEDDSSQGGESDTENEEEEDTGDDTEGDGEEEEGNEEEEDDETEDGGPLDKRRYTAKGEVRLRSIKWSKEEKFSLFFNISRIQARLRQRGKNSKEKRRDAWQEIVGNYISPLFLPFLVTK